MDYSLLVGVHHVDSNNFKYDIDYVWEQRQIPYWRKDNGGITSSDGNSIYFIGIIDILTTYGVKKHLETSFKSFFAEEETLSAVNPNLYSARFQHFLISQCTEGTT